MVVVIGKKELSMGRELRQAVCKEGQQELRQAGITQADRMQVDPVGNSPQTEGAEGVVSTERSQILIQDIEHYKAPLLDCTNRMCQAGEVGDRAGKGSMKGQ